MKKTGLVLQETPMVVNLPRAGTYSIGCDFGDGLDESVASFVRLGDPGEPDELVAILRRDRETGKWVKESSAKEKQECGYCGGTGEVACSSTDYMVPALLVAVFIGIVWYSGHTAFAVGFFSFFVLWCLFDLVERMDK